MEYNISSPTIYFMHFKRIENIFKLKKIAWAENDCLPWMLLCNPLGAWVISYRAVETDTDVFFAKMRGGGRKRSKRFLLINTVNVLLPCTSKRATWEDCPRAGGSEPMEDPAVGCPPFCWRRLLRTHQTNRHSSHFLLHVWTGSAWGG